MRNPTMVRTILMSVIATMLVGCGPASKYDAMANCQEEIRDQMRDPRGVSVRFLEAEEVGQESYRIRYRVRGQNGFGASVEQHFVCNWTLTERTDSGYRYRVFVSRGRR